MDSVMTEKRLIEHAQASFELAEQGVSRLNAEALAMEGMSGRKTRHLYNNLCNLAGCRYLEIGCWKGSSTVAALQGNDATGVVIDNWSEFGSPKHAFLDNVNNNLLPNQVVHMDQDCWDALGYLKDREFLVYMYDGGHTLEDHTRAITVASSKLKSECIVIIDDWNDEKVRVGTREGIKQIGATVAWSREIFTGYNGDSAGYWNGVAVFVLRI